MVINEVAFTIWINIEVDIVIPLIKTNRCYK